MTPPEASDCVAEDGKALGSSAAERGTNHCNQEPHPDSHGANAGDSACNDLAKVTDVSSIASRSSVLDLVLTCAEPDLAGGVALFGLGFLVVPFLVDLIGAGRLHGFLDADELRKRFGPLDVAFMIREICMTVDDLDFHIKQSRIEDLETEIHGMKKWRQHLTACLRLLHKRVALAFLGLTSAASETDINRVYKKMALECHPDKGGDPVKFQELQEMRNRISEAEKTADDPRSADAPEAEENSVDAMDPRRLRLSMHANVMRLWENVKKTTDEICITCGDKAHPETALSTLRMFVDAFVSSDIQALPHADLQSVQLKFDKFIKVGAEIITGSALIDPGTTKAILSMHFDCVIKEHCKSSQLHVQCSKLLEAALAVRLRSSEVMDKFRRSQTCGKAELKQCISLFEIIVDQQIGIEKPISSEQTTPESTLPMSSELSVAGGHLMPTESAKPMELHRHPEKDRPEESVQVPESDQPGEGDSLAGSEQLMQDGQAGATDPGAKSDHIPERQEVVESAQDWECPACSQLNEVSAAECAACGERQPSSSQARDQAGQTPHTIEVQNSVVSEMQPEQPPEVLSRTAIATQQEEIADAAKSSSQVSVARSSDSAVLTHPEDEDLMTFEAPPIQCGSYVIKLRMLDRGLLEEVWAGLWDGEIQVGTLVGIYVFREGNFLDACRQASDAASSCSALLFNSKGYPKEPFKNLVGTKACTGGFLYIDEVRVAEDLCGSELACSFVRTVLQCLAGAMKRVTLAMCAREAAAGAVAQHLNSSSATSSALESYWLHCGFRLASSGGKFYFSDISGARKRHTSDSMTTSDHPNSGPRKRPSDGDAEHSSLKRPRNIATPHSPCSQTQRAVAEGDVVMDMNFEEGSRVQYWSKRLEKWIIAKVLRRNPNGSYDLDAKPRAKPEFIRPVMVTATDAELSAVKQEIEVYEQKIKDLTDGRNDENDDITMQPTAQAASGAADQELLTVKEEIENYEQKVKELLVGRPDTAVEASSSSSSGCSMLTPRMQYALMQAAKTGSNSLSLDVDRFISGQPGCQYWGCKHFPPHLQEVFKAFLRGMGDVFAVFIRLLELGELPTAPSIMDALSPSSGMPGHRLNLQLGKHFVSHFFGVGGKVEYVIRAVTKEASLFYNAREFDDADDAHGGDTFRSYHDLPIHMLDGDFELIESLLIPGSSPDPL